MDNGSMKFTLGILLSSTLLLAQPGWHTVKDKTGACQVSVPPNWTILSNPGWVNSPEHMSTTVLAGLRPYKPWSPETLKTLDVDKVFENSDKRSFYVTKASKGTPAAVSYHVEAPGGAKACVVQISATPSYSLEEIKAIALSLSAAK